MTRTAAPRSARRIPWSPPGRRRRASAERRLVRGRWAKIGEALLHQQLWCFGADIRCSEGNLLLEYGFHRRRTGAGEVGSSAYFHTGGDGALALWGWGIWYGERDIGSVFLRRYAFRPKWNASAECPEAHTPERMGGWTAPRTDAESHTRRLMAGLCDAMADYEQWVEAQLPGWRATVLREWDTPGAAAGATAAAWTALAERFRLNGDPGSTRLQASALASSHPRLRLTMRFP